MEMKKLAADISVTAQILPADIAAIAEAGFKSVICNRPDGEGADQPGFKEIENLALAAGLQIRYLPAESGKVTDAQGTEFGRLMDELPKPVLAYCRTGMRSTTMWALSNAGKLPLPTLIEAASKAGYDLKGVVRRIVNGGKTPVEIADSTHDIVIVGGGAAGVAVASSLLARNPDLDIAIVDPADIHYYSLAGPWWAPESLTPRSRRAPWALCCHRGCTGSRRQLLRSSRSETPSFWMAAVW
jgi:sulfide:quinone oxidoreductase